MMETTNLHPAIIQASRLIKAGDVIGADEVFNVLVENEGDHALVEILDGLPSKDLMGILREFDGSKNSVVNLSVTPGQFAKAIAQNALYGDKEHDALRSAICSVVFREGAETSYFLEACLDVEGACEALADFLVNHSEEIVHFFETGSFLLHEEGRCAKSEVSDGDWMELTWTLKYECSETLLREVLLALRERTKDRDRAVHLERQAQDAALDAMETDAAGGFEGGVSQPMPEADSDGEKPNKDSVEVETAI